MKHLLMVCGLVILLVACGAPRDEEIEITGSGILVRRPFDLDGFRRIDASSAARVSVIQAGEYRVELVVDDNVEPYVDVRVDDETLHVTLEDGTYTGITLQLQVSMPELAGITLDGGSSARGEVTGDALAVGVNGGSLAILGGSVRDLTVNAAGGSQALLGDLAAVDVVLDVGGASRVQINASGEVTGVANGSSTVSVSGSPTSVDVETNGGSSVNRE
ncbi:MAG TPA: DUF2807 domain-containing protein [Anaerolineae bacterium]|nr:DUF2807 domain-containing protein [Anaerolineae bacterium]